MTPPGTELSRLQGTVFGTWCTLAVPTAIVRTRDGRLSIFLKLRSRLARLAGGQTENRCNRFSHGKFGRGLSTKGLTVYSTLPDLESLLQNASFWGGLGIEQRVMN